MSPVIKNNAIPDGELLLRLAGNDAEAFTVIYNRYWETLYRSAFRVLKDHDACLDIVHEIYTWLWAHRRELQIAHLRAYLLSAVKFKVVNHIRAGRIRESFFGEAAQLLPPETADAGNNLAAKELDTAVRQCISRLPERCRTVYDLSRNEHLSHREISAKMGISVKTVENQITIALRRIRESLGSLLLFLLVLCGR
ncbi:RNA polymerase sigma-70 factor [Compostibacter hankyongensis]|uniref:RNA polymerase sigma-70 factor n=1 Tax=Compostibacter hankyongensis TaxID=1007089 RepID=A0ABP8FBW5_9BACT